MTESPDVETKVAAWKMATAENLPQREIARRLGISQPTVSRYVAEGRLAETYWVTFAKAELRRDVAHYLRDLIGTWMREMQEEPDRKFKLQISQHVAALFAQLSKLLGLDEPTRVAVGQDAGEPAVPDPELVRAIEAAKTNDTTMLSRIRAGLPMYPTEEESA